MSEMLSAYKDLMEFLEPDEQVEKIVFGEWGWGHGRTELGYGEPDPPPVPFDKRGVALTLDESKPYMSGWSFDGGYGAPNCYAVTVWTNRRVIWVTQYDGSTCLDSARRNPENYWPSMPGG